MISSSSVNCSRNHTFHMNTRTKGCWRDYTCSPNITISVRTEWAISSPPNGPRCLLDKSLLETSVWAAMKFVLNKVFVLISDQCQFLNIGCQEWNEMFWANFSRLSTQTYSEVFRFFHGHTVCILSFIFFCFIFKTYFFIQYNSIQDNPFNLLWLISWICCFKND